MLQTQQKLESLYSNNDNNNSFKIKVIIIIIIIIIIINGMQLSSFRTSKAKKPMQYFLNLDSIRDDLSCFVMPKAVFTNANWHTLCQNRIMGYYGVKRGGGGGSSLLSGHCTWTPSHGSYVETGPHVSFTAHLVGDWIAIRAIQTLCHNSAS
jgi:hypothetical protein